MRIVRIAVGGGVEGMRLTGGEPLLRPDRVNVVTAIASIEPRPGISITTNGIDLTRLAELLKRVSLARIDVSLNTSKPDRFYQLTHRSRLADVLTGITTADATGLRPVKLNALQLRRINDGETPDLLAFTIGHGYELRLIEQMPLDAGHTWRRDSMMTTTETMVRLGGHFTLTPLPGRGTAPTERFLVDDGPATVSVTTLVTAPFCGAYDQLRLTTDGQLRNCLFVTEGPDLRTPIREGAGSEGLAGIFHRCLLHKLPGYGINGPSFLQPQHPMNTIGGQLFTRMCGYHDGV